MLRSVPFLLAAFLALGLSSMAEPDGPRWYYLGPWVEDADPDIGVHWRAPRTTVGSVDLRGSAGGMGFFATNAPLGMSGYMALGTSLDASLTTTQWGSWKEALGIPADKPLPSSLLDALWLTLTEYADPTGTLRAPPLMPTSRGILELHLGGHSVVKSRRFTGSDDPAWPNIRARVHEDMRKVWTETETAAKKMPRNGPQARALQRIPRKVLGGLVLEYSRKGIAWRDLVPSDVPLDGYEDPETTYSDGFNRTEDPLGSTSPWTVLLGAYRTNNNVLFTKVTTDWNAPSTARYNHALSTSHQYSRITMTAQPSTLSWASGAVRYSLTEITYYAGNLRSASPQNVLTKMVNGSPTTIGSSSGTNVTPFVTGVRASGSTITLVKDGVDVFSVTDTTITGNLYAGFAMRSASTSERADDWYVEDTTPPPAENPIPSAMFLRRQMAH